MNHRYYRYSTSNRVPLIKRRIDKCINKVMINYVVNIVSTACNLLPRTVVSAKSLSLFIKNIDIINIKANFHAQHA